MYSIYIYIYMVFVVCCPQPGHRAWGIKQAGFGAAEVSRKGSVEDLAREQDPQKSEPIENM